jgi:hypothetical protein
MSAEEFANRHVWSGANTDEDALAHRLLGKPNHTLPPLDTSSLRSIGSVRSHPSASEAQCEFPNRFSEKTTEAGVGGLAAAPSSPLSKDAREELSQEGQRAVPAGPPVKPASPANVPEPLASFESSNTGTEDDVASEHSEQSEQHTEVDEQRQKLHTNEKIGEGDNQGENDDEGDGEGSGREARLLQSDEIDDISEASTDPPGVQASRIGPSSRPEVKSNELQFDTASDIEEIPDVDEMYEVESSGDGGEATAQTSPALSGDKPATADVSHTGAEDDHSQAAESPKLSARDRLRLRLQHFQEAKPNSPKSRDNSSVELSNSWDDSFDAS